MTDAERRAHTTSVFIAEDHPVFRGAIERIVRDNGYVLAGVAEDGRVALTEIRTTTPDIAVLDIDLPSMSGQKIIEAIQALGIPTRTLVVSGTADQELAISTIRCGASGYVPKTSPPDEIAKALARTARGGTYLPEALHCGLAAEIRKTADGFEPLSDRELQVLALTADGKTVLTVAAELHLSRETVKTHLKHTYAKLNVNSAASAVAEAMRRGLLI